MPISALGIPLPIRSIWCPYLKPVPSLCVGGKSRFGAAYPIIAPTVQSAPVFDLKDRAAVATEISLILAATFWGLNFAATKYAAESIPPLLLVALRFTVGGLLLLLVLRLFEPKSRLRRSDVLPMAALGCSPREGGQDPQPAGRAGDHAPQ